MNLDAILTDDDIKDLDSLSYDDSQRKLLAERATLWVLLAKVDSARFTPYHEGLPWDEIAQALQKAGRE